MSRKIWKFRTDKFDTKTNGNFDLCEWCKRLETSRLHELHESQFPFVFVSNLSVLNFDFFCSCIRDRWHTARLGSRWRVSACAVDVSSMRNAVFAAIQWVCANTEADDVLSDETGPVVFGTETIALKCWYCWHKADTGHVYVVWCNLRAECSALYGINVLLKPPSDINNLK